MHADDVHKITASQASQFQTPVSILDFLEQELTPEEFRGYLKGTIHKIAYEQRELQHRQMVAEVKRDLPRFFVTEKFVGMPFIGFSQGIDGPIPKKDSVVSSNSLLPVEDKNEKALRGEKEKEIVRCAGYTCQECVERCLESHKGAPAA